VIAGPLEQHIDWGDEEPMEVERVEDEDEDGHEDEGGHRA